MSEKHEWQEPPIAAVIQWVNCIECGKKFRTDNDHVLNMGDFRMHARNVYSFTHAKCEEEA